MSRDSAADAFPDERPAHHATGQERLALYAAADRVRLYQAHSRPRYVRRRLELDKMEPCFAATA